MVSGLRNQPSPGQKFFLTFLLIALFLLRAVMAHAEAHRVPYPADIQKIKQRGRIIVAQYAGVQKGFFEYGPQDNPSSEPGCLYEGQRIFGVDILLAKRIAKVLGVDLTLDRTCRDYDSVCERVALGKADVGISKLSITLDRAQYVRFTKPYARLHLCLLLDRLYESKARLKGRVIRHCQENRVRIGVQAGSALKGYQSELFPKSQAVLYDSLEQEIASLLKGKIHFVLDDSAAVVWRLKASPELSLQLRTVTIPGYRDPIGVAVSPESPNLLALLNLLIEDADIRRAVNEIATLN